MTTIKEQGYQFEISQLLSMDETGLLSSFVLQMDSIISESSLESPTERRLIEETIQFLYSLSSANGNAAY